MIAMRIQPTQKSLEGRKGKKARTVYVHVGIWHDKKTGHIHIACPQEGSLHSTISNDTKSVRYHKNLFEKLKKILVREGRWE